MDTNDTCVKQTSHYWGWGNTNVEAILIAVRALKWLVPGDAEITREMSLLLSEDATVGRYGEQLEPEA